MYSLYAPRNFSVVQESFLGAFTLSATVHQNIQVKSSMVEKCHNILSLFNTSIYIVCREDMMSEYYTKTLL